jgi:hypothetical protein
MARAMRISARSPGVFSRRDSVGCEHSAGRVGQAPVGELEHRIVAKAVGVVAVLVAGGDHQQAEAQHVGKVVLDAIRRAGSSMHSARRRATPRRSSTSRSANRPPSEESEPPVEAGDDRLAGDR